MSTNTVECPYCGGENTDLWEVNINDNEFIEEYECQCCGKIFILERHFDVWYTANNK